MTEKTLGGYRVNVPQSNRKSTIENIRIRPVDGGLRTDVTGELIDPKQASAMRDVFFFKNEMRKAHGGIQLGLTFDDPVIYTGLWERLDGILIPVALTTKDLYYYASAKWNKVSPAGILTGTQIHPVTVKFFEDSMYFVSYDFELRSWDGDPASSHAVVTGGFAAKAMELINNRIVLGYTIESGSASSHTIRWTQNGTVAFTGPGSGVRDFPDRSDGILNIKKLGPYRGVIYKNESLSEIRATGDAEFVFESNEIVGGLGLMLANSVAECAAGHFFASSDEDIYLYTGSGFQVVGTDIKYELFALLNQSSLERAVGWYNKPTKEYIIAIPIGTAPNTAASLYYAYDVLKKRWRSGVYTGVTSFGDYRTIVGITWDEDVGTWDEATDTWNDESGVGSRNRTMVGTSSKKVIILDESSLSFDSQALQFEWTSGDIVGKNDGDEVTLLELLIGYIVDGTATVTVEASTDFGKTFSVASTATLGGSQFSTEDVAYAHVPLEITGDNIRIKIKNSNQNEKIRIISLSPRIDFTASSRVEATK